MRGLPRLIGAYSFFSDPNGRIKVVPPPPYEPKSNMDRLKEWQATLTPREKALHALASEKLRAESRQPGDSGSYYPEKCRAFLTWLKKSQKDK